MKTVDFSAHYDPDGNYWVRRFGNQALFGITDFGKEFLGPIKSIDFNVNPGDHLTANNLVAHIESAKTLSEIHVPISGIVVTMNQLVIQKPSNINEDPYGMGWLLQIRSIKDEDWNSLIKPSVYEKLISSFFNK